MVASIQTRGRENTRQKHYDHCNESGWLTNKGHTRNNGSIGRLFFIVDKEEENVHYKNIRKTNEEPISTSDDADLIAEEMQHTVGNFNDKKAPGIDEIRGGIYPRKFNVFPDL
jgi:hypothetical protein